MAVSEAHEIRRALDDAIERRAELYRRLSQEYRPELAEQVTRLAEQIEELWAKERSLRLAVRFGERELIIARARAEERLERESRSVRVPA